MAGSGVDIIPSKYDVVNILGSDCSVVEQFDFTA